MESKDEQQVEIEEGRRVGVVISVRLKPEEADLLDELAERHGLSLSDTVREGLSALRARDASRLQAYTASIAIESHGMSPREFTEGRKSLVTDQ